MHHHEHRPREGECCQSYPPHWQYCGQMLQINMAGNDSANHNEHKTTSQQALPGSPVEHIYYNLYIYIYTHTRIILCLYVCGWPHSCSVDMSLWNLLYWDILVVNTCLCTQYTLIYHGHAVLAKHLICIWLTAPAVWHGLIINQTQLGANIAV